MATVQRTRPRAVAGGPLRAAWQPKSVLRHSVSAAPRTIIFYNFFTIVATELFCYVQKWLVMMQLQYEWKTITVSCCDNTYSMFRLQKQSNVPSVQVYFFQNLEHPKIGYFGYNKLSFDWLNMFLATKKNILVLVGYTRKSLGRLVRSWNKGRQKECRWSRFVGNKHQSRGT